MSVRTLPALPWFGWLAALAGIIASGRGALSGEGGLNALLLAALVACWALLWWGLMDVDWAGFLRARQPLRKQTLPLSVPYAEPGSLAERATLELARTAEWAQHNPSHWQGPAASAMAALALSLALSARLGGQVFALNALALALCGLARVAGAGVARDVARAGVDAALPMLAGAVLFAPLSPSLVILAAGVGLTWAARINTQFHVGYALVMAVLLASRHTLGAFLAGLFWLPHFLAGFSLGRGRASSLWLAATVLVSAIALT